MCEMYKADTIPVHIQVHSYTWLTNVFSEILFSSIYIIYNHKLGGGFYTSTHLAHLKVPIVLYWKI